MFLSKKQGNIKTGKQIPTKQTSKTVQKSIDYINMFENGICDIGDGRYSITFSFDDISYHTAKKDDQLNIFQRYCELLEFFSPEIELQVSIVNRFINEDVFKKTMLLSHIGDSLDHLRTERNNILLQAATKGKNNVVSQKYFTITVRAETYEKAKTKLMRLEADVIQNFKTLGSAAHSLSGTERCEVLYNYFHPQEEFNFEYRDLLYNGLTTKDIISPSSLDFKKDTFSFDDNYSTVLYLKEYPNEISDNFIKELSEIGCSSCINIHMQSMDKSSSMDIIRSRIAMMENQLLEVQRKANKYNEVAMIPHELQYSLEEAEDLREAINSHGMKLFKMTLTISLSTTSENKLTEYIERVKAIGRQHSCNIMPISYLQNEGMNASLIIGNNAVKENIKSLKFSRTLTSAAAGIFIPLTTQELYQSTGIYYGLNQISNNLIVFDRKKLKNPNGVVLGSPGSGKSFICKREILDVFISTRDSIIILDPEGEYGAIVQMLGGQVVALSNNSSNFINPFDINENYADKDNPLALKADFIISMIQQICRTILSDITLSIIDRCVNFTYAKFFTKKNCPPPTFHDFWKMLKEQPEIEAQQLAVSLERYITGNLNIFSHASNVNLNSRIISFDVRDLGKQLKSLGMLVALDFIWNKITENRAKGVRTWLYFDEFYLFFNDEHSSNFFFELWKRARKWGAVPTGITQNVEDLLQSPVARRILSNTEFAFLLNQSASDRDELAHIYNISPHQMSYVTNSGEGEGLIIGGKAIIPFRDKFPKNTAIYKVLSTKFNEDENEHGKTEKLGELQYAIS
ncbi:conjugal transfer protein TraE [Clostridia bacterium]|nr:conjugal transfer protein TraE [Clostridia bacterium]